jgi:parvulin-like peptidyl-prolyl isomerase
MSKWINGFTRVGKSKSMFWLLGLVIVLTLAAVAIRKPANAMGATASEPAIVATVNGSPIPSKFFRMYLKNGIEGLGLDPTTADGERTIARLKDGIIAELIDRQLIESEARRRGLVVPEAQLTDDYSRSVTQMGGDAKFNAYLSEAGISDAEFRQTLLQEAYGQLMRDELGKEVHVTDDETRAFYDSEKGNPSMKGLFIAPECVRASHILIGARRSQIASDIQSAEGKATGADLERLIAAELSKRRGAASKVLALARAGASFEGLAQRYSDDPATRASGGALGLFPKMTHTASFDEAAFSLEPGRISNIVETEFGFHIIKVTERFKAHHRSLDETRPEIAALLLKRKQASHLKDWIALSRGDARIRVEPFYAAAQRN